MEEQNNTMSKKKFWVKFSIWACFACLIPVFFLVYRYELFTKVSKIQVGGWGLFALIIIFVFIFAVFKYVKVMLDIKWSMTGQIVLGLTKIIVPMFAILMCVYCIRNSVDRFLQSWGFATICELIAIPLNPFPQYIYELSQGKTMDVFEYYSKIKGDNNANKK